MMTITVATVIISMVWPSSISNVYNTLNAAGNCRLISGAVNALSNKSLIWFAIGNKEIMPDFCSHVMVMLNLWWACLTHCAWIAFMFISLHEKQQFCYFGYRISKKYAFNYSCGTRWWMASVRPCAWVVHTHTDTRARKQILPTFYTERPRQ